MLWFMSHHLISWKPVSFLFDPGLGAFAAHCERLHHQTVFDGQN